MKKINAPFTLLFLFIPFVASTFCMGQDLKITDKVFQDTSGTYKDGSYEGKSRSVYTGEPFWGSVRVTLKNGSFTGINFVIRDSNLHETFNENYEKHFLAIPEYIQQCRNDWKGVQTYPRKLSETQNPDKIDAISGATWSYNIFRASLKDALKNAKTQTDTLSSLEGIE
ncbi:MAG: FMN-binding protein [Bacteroidia bacterium]|nr:FMN-binding protein [Bacteroidia bacterium]